MQTLWQDLRYGARTLLKNPVFTLIAVITLGLGIGANTAIFSLINTVALRPLPVAHPEALGVIAPSGDFFRMGAVQGRNQTFTFAQFDAIAARQRAFSGLAAFSTRSFDLSDGGQVRMASGLFVTPNFLSVLGVTPVLGSWMRPDAEDTSTGLPWTWMDTL